MSTKNAFHILFVQEFQGRTLFKNQIDLVNELIHTPGSAYHTQKDNLEEYGRMVSRLKAYISQLFSEEAKRNITVAFKNSLEIVLKNKLQDSTENVNEILNDIINDLRDKNVGQRYLSLLSPRKQTKTDSPFIEDLIEARYISIFTPREINLEFNILNQKQNLIDLLLEDLFFSFKEKRMAKKYRFNFPLHQTCVLFWRGLEKTLTTYIQTNSNSLAYVIPILIASEQSLFASINTYNPINFNHEIARKISKELIKFLSRSHIISVFHLPAPIYLVPSIAINPNDNFQASAYLFLQSNSGEDSIHRLSSQEFILWKLFVWENLKLLNYGDLIEYKADF